jgi:hypothetical protein
MKLLVEVMRPGVVAGRVRVFEEPESSDLGATCMPGGNFLRKACSRGLFTAVSEKRSNKILTSR